MTPHLTLNYGLRWEFSGAATNPNEVYSSPTPADLLGPSTAPFQPGTLNGVAESAGLSCSPKPVQGATSSIRRRTSAWRGTRTSREGLLGKLLGQSVYRASTSA